MEKEEIKNQVKSYFEKAYGRELPDVEIGEIILNLSGLFKLLNQFHKQDLEEQNKLKDKNNGSANI